MRFVLYLKQPPRRVAAPRGCVRSGARKIRLVDNGASRSNSRAHKRRAWRRLSCLSRALPPVHLLHPAALHNSCGTCVCQLPPCRSCWTRSVMPRAWRVGNARSGNSLTRHGCPLGGGARRCTGATAISSTGTPAQEISILRPACQEASSTKKLAGGRLCSRRYGRG